MNKPIVLFDLDDTLISYRESERHGLFTALAELMLPASDLVLSRYQEINTALWREYAAGRITPERLRRRRFEELLDALNKEISLALPLADGYLRHFSSCGVPTPGAEELLRKLRESGHRLGVITNGFTRMQRPRLEISGLTSYFETVVISDEVDLAKPDPRIFQLALDKMGAEDPEEVYFVGDNPADDIGGAGSFGMRTIWYNRYREESTCPDADFTTDDLALIPRLLLNHQSRQVR